jgi:hypothetical protein
MVNTKNSDKIFRKVQKMLRTIIIPKMIWSLPQISNIQCQRLDRI